MPGGNEQFYVGSPPVQDANSPVATVVGPVTFTTGYILQSNGGGQTSNVREIAIFSRKLTERGTHRHRGRHDREAA